jgi:enoyl-[acyl-carrier-protein] reductase (NADH)
LHRPEFAEQVLAMLDAGIPVEALGRIIIFNGFMEGKWNPDVAFIIAEPVMKMIATMGLTAGIEKIKMSMSDITNNEQIQSIVRTKVNAEETAEAAKGVKQDIKKIEKKGLMAKPNQEEME